MKDMNVLFVIPESEQGGGQMYVALLAEGLHEKHIPLTVCVSSKGWLTQRLEEKGIPVAYFRFGRRSFSFFRIFLFILELRAYLARHPTSILHLHGSNALFGVLSARCLRNRPRVFFTWGGLSFLHPEWKENKIVKHIGYALFRLLIPLVDHSLFVCRSDYEYAKKIKIISKRKEQFCAVISNGIENDILFSKEKARRIFESTIPISLGNTYIVGSIARLAYQKNIELLIDVASIIKKRGVHCIFIVIGYGGLLEALTARIKTVGLEQCFFLLHTVNDARRLISAFDLFVLTSRYEGMPFALLEALYSGVPVISADVGGISEVVRHDREGLLVPSSDSKLYATYIQELKRDASRAARLAAQGKQCIIQKFTLTRMRQLTYDLYTTASLSRNRASRKKII